MKLILTDIRISIVILVLNKLELAKENRISKVKTQANPKVVPMPIWQKKTFSCVFPMPIQQGGKRHSHVVPRVPVPIWQGGTCAS